MVAIRRATPADAAAVAELFLDTFHATYDFPLGHTDDECRAWVRDDLIPTEETWVAVDDGRIVAMLAVKPGWIEQLYVDPSHHGKGIGSRLVDLAKTRSPEGLTLWTFQVNDHARRFYERHGFVAVELTDGSANDERQPDVRYEWTG